MANKSQMCKTGEWARRNGRLLALKFLDLFLTCHTAMKKKQHTTDNIPKIKHTNETYSPFFSLHSNIWLPPFFFLVNRRLPHLVSSYKEAYNFHFHSHIVITYFPNLREKNTKAFSLVNSFFFFLKTITIVIFRK